MDDMPSDLRAAIEDRDRYARDTILSAAAAEGLTDMQIDFLRRRAYEAAMQMTATEAFYYCWWLQYFAEGGE